MPSRIGDSDVVHGQPDLISSGSSNCGLLTLRRDHSNSGLMYSGDPLLSKLGVERHAELVASWSARGGIFSLMDNKKEIVSCSNLNC